MDYLFATQTCNTPTPCDTTYILATWRLPFRISCVVCDLGLLLLKTVISSYPPSPLLDLLPGLIRIHSCSVRKTRDAYRNNRKTSTTTSSEHHQTGVADRSILVRSRIFLNLSASYRPFTRRRSQVLFLSQRLVVLQLLYVCRLRRFNDLNLSCSICASFIVPSTFSATSCRRSADVHEHFGHFADALADRFLGPACALTW